MLKLALKVCHINVVCDVCNVYVVFDVCDVWLELIGADVADVTEVTDVKRHLHLYLTKIFFFNMLNMSDSRNELD